MSSGKKVLNVFGIIFAWILSIALVLSLIVSPIILSALSLLSPKTLANAVTNIDMSSLVAPEVGGEGSEDGGMAALLSTNAAKELFQLYATDITNSLSGKNAESKFTVEALQKVVEENIDELIAVMREMEAVPTDASDEEIKTAIKTGITENMDEIMENLPDPKELTEQVSAENPELQVAFDIIGRAQTIKFTVIGEIILISVLIFVCRLFDFKGVRWLSVDLFIASGVCVLLSVGLLLSSGVIAGFAADEKIIGSIAKSLASTLTTGVIIRTVVMLIAAIGLMVAYVFIKKALAKKKLAVSVATETPVEEVSSDEVFAEPTPDSQE